MQLAAPQPRGLARGGWHDSYRPCDLHPCAGGGEVRVGQWAAREAAAAMGLAVPSGQTHRFDEEGYVVAARGDTLILAGNETEPYEGTYFAVYDFLDSLGCRWYFPGEFGEVLPRLATVAVKPGRRAVRPELRVRDTWYSGHLPS